MCDRAILADNWVRKWERWDPAHSEQLYEKGKRCWGGPDRSTRIKLTCGDGDDVLSVEEPAKCEYEMIVQTPYACDEARLKELQDSLVSGAHVAGVDDVVLPTDIE